MPQAEDERRPPDHEARRDAVLPRRRLVEMQHRHLDMFCGAGSTLIACEKTGRICRCIELYPKHCDAIRHSWTEVVHESSMPKLHLILPVDAHLLVRMISVFNKC